MEPWAKILTALDVKNMGRAVTLGTPTDGGFTYPVEKRPTRETVEALCKAKANLGVV